ncbi:signal peptidase I, partial [Bacteroides sartorii]|nr:signal peptidase I [Phocaeicola sartorii]
MMKEKTKKYLSVAIDWLLYLSVAFLCVSAVWLLSQV